VRSTPLSDRTERPTRSGCAGGAPPSSCIPVPGGSSEPPGVGSRGSRDLGVNDRVGLEALRNVVARRAVVEPGGEIGHVSLTCAISCLKGHASQALDQLRVSLMVRDGSLARTGCPPSRSGLTRAPSVDRVAAGNRRPRTALRSTSRCRVVPGPLPSVRPARRSALGPPAVRGCVVTSSHLYDGQSQRVGQLGQMSPLLPAVDSRHRRPQPRTGCFLFRVPPG
jgi:hypothetical protein